MSHETRPDLLPKTLDEALGRLVEEMHEAGVEIGHIMRFGRVARDNASGIVYDNDLALRKELNDLKDAIQRYEEFDDLHLFGSGGNAQANRTRETGHSLTASEKL